MVKATKGKALVKRESREVVPTKTKELMVQTVPVHKKKKRITFKIYRNDPSKGVAPHYQEYTHEIDERTTVLDALDQIKWYQDGTLTYRKSCRSAICGSCAMKINGHPKLACRTRVEKELELFDEIRVDPMGNAPSMKDLVVDLEPFFKRVKSVQNYLIPKPGVEQQKEENPMTPAEHKHIDSAADCILCGCCHSDCDAARTDEKFIGPAAFVKAFRFVEDPRDAAKKERLKNLVENSGLWSCVHAMECAQACPKNINPTDKIAKLRQLAIEEGFTKDYGAKHAIAMQEGVQHSGKLEEHSLPLKTFGIFKTIGMSGMAIDMLTHGKMPTPFHKKTKGIKDIRYLMEEGEKWKKEEEEERHKYPAATQQTNEEKKP